MSNDLLQRSELAPRASLAPMDPGYLPPVSRRRIMAIGRFDEATGGPVAANPRVGKVLQALADWIIHAKSELVVALACDPASASPVVWDLIRSRFDFLLAEALVAKSAGGDAPVRVLLPLFRGGQPAGITGLIADMPDGHPWKPIITRSKCDPLNVDLHMETIYHGLAQSSLVLAAGGSTTTRINLSLAHYLGKPIIPFPIFGGVAREFHEERFLHYLRQRGVLTNERDRDQLHRVLEQEQYSNPSLDDVSRIAADYPVPVLVGASGPLGEFSLSVMKRSAWVLGAQLFFGVAMLALCVMLSIWACSDARGASKREEQDVVAQVFAIATLMLLTPVACFCASAAKRLLEFDVARSRPILSHTQLFFQSWTLGLFAALYSALVILLMQGTAAPDGPIIVAPANILGTMSVLTAIGLYFGLNPGIGMKKLEDWVGSRA